MKTLITILLFLFFLQSNGQESQHWKKYLKEGKLSQTEYADLVHGDSVLKGQHPTVKLGVVVRSFSGTVAYSPNQKYDTVRVLIAYADTAKQKTWVGQRFMSHKEAGCDSIANPNHLYYHAITTYKDIPIFPLLTWSFVYIVREICGHCPGGSVINYPGFTTAIGQLGTAKHLKYLTEDKKDIPKSWVILIEKPLN